MGCWIVSGCWDWGLRRSERCDVLVGNWFGFGVGNWLIAEGGDVGDPCIGFDIFIVANETVFRFEVDAHIAKAGSLECFGEFWD